MSDPALFFQSILAIFGAACIVRAGWSLTGHALHIWGVRDVTCQITNNLNTAGGSVTINGEERRV